MGIMPRGWREILCHRDGEKHHELIAKVWRSQIELVAKYGGCRVIESVG